MIDHLKTLNEWATCRQGDLMIAISMEKAGAHGWSTWQDVVLVLCDFVESSFVPGDNKPQEAIDAVRELVKGRISVRQVCIAIDSVDKLGDDACSRADYIAAHTAYAAVDAAHGAAAFVEAIATESAACAAQAAEVAVRAAGGGLSLAEMADLIRSRLTIGDLS